MRPRLSRAGEAANVGYERDNPSAQHGPRNEQAEQQHHCAGNGQECDQVVARTRLAPIDEAQVVHDDHAVAFGRELLHRKAGDVQHPLRALHQLEGRDAGRRLGAFDLFRDPVRTVQDFPPARIRRDEPAVIVMRAR
jgi:hypothetical protein